MTENGCRLSSGGELIVVDIRIRKEHPLFFGRLNYVERTACCCGETVLSPSLT